MSPGRRLTAALGCALLMAAAPVGALDSGTPSTREVEPAIARALERLYNFDFDAAHSLLDTYVADSPSDPLGHVFQAATYLFSELDRLGILASKFFSDDRNMHADKKARPDPEVRERLIEALDRARALGDERLAEDPDDKDALFALTLAEGIYTDYLGLIEKKGIKSFGAARKANVYAQRLLALDPDYYDAHLGTGVNEYLVGSLPFFVRWFVRMEGIEGDKEVALERLRLVAERGTYLGPFARILMSIITLREGDPEHALELLESLRGEYPENPLLRQEVAELSARIAASELAAD